MVAGCPAWVELVGAYGGYAQGEQRLSGVDCGVRGFVPSPRVMRRERVDPVTSYLILERLEGLG